MREIQNSFQCKRNKFNKPIQSEHSKQVQPFPASIVICGPSGGSLLLNSQRACLKCPAPSLHTPIPGECHRDISIINCLTHLHKSPTAPSALGQLRTKFCPSKVLRERTTMTIREAIKGREAGPQQHRERESVHPQDWELLSYSQTQKQFLCP